MSKLMILEVNWEGNEGKVMKEEFSWSVRPFLNGLEGLLGADFPEGEFHSGDDLLAALRQFRKSDTPYLYVAAHGLRKQIVAPDRGVYSSTIIRACKGSKGKGYVFSACDFVNPKTATEFLKETKADFVAGYSGAAPMHETVFVELLFLLYLLYGRLRRKREPETDRRSLVPIGDGFRIQNSKSAITVGHWVYEDLHLAALFGFEVYSLKVSQGKKPQLVSASRTWKEKVKRTGARLIRF
jgi:hypothetical protein